MANSKFQRALRRSALATALGVCFASGALAQSNTAGAVFGQAQAGDKVVVENPATGVRREVTVGSDGSYRASSLPVGTYRVTLQRADGSTEIRENVGVSVGTSTPVSFAAGDAATLDAVEVTGSMVNPIDVSSVESATILTEAQIDRIPVSRNVTAVALLAPGTVRGDNRFGDLASFGGASVAENAYFINGFNVTNINKGTAFNQIPFEAIAEQQVKTGGYGAEFGRSLGGVVNIITKRGTNDWKGGVSAFWAPESLAEGRAIAFHPDQSQPGYQVVDSGTKDDLLRYNVWSSGALVQDRLFLFALLQGQQIDRTDNTVQSQTDESTIDSPQGLVKIDWNITDNHLLELTAFRDRTEEKGVQYKRPVGNEGIGGAGNFNGTFNSETGGDNIVARWTGYLTDSLTLSAMYGQGEYSRQYSDSNSADCPLVVDVRAVSDPVSGCWVNTSIGDPNAGDERTSWRVDGEWVWNAHTFRFGLDREEYETTDGSIYSGGIYWRYLDTAPGRVLNGGVVPNGVTEVVRLRYFENGGTFLTKNNAWYLEDSWQVTDNFMAFLGVRNEGFENLNSSGGAFVDVQDTWAPRLGFSWDVMGDSTMKVFGNAGRYYIPVYSNTNVRLAGAELDYQEFYTFTGIDPVTGAPTLGQQIGTRSYTSDGEIPDPRGVVDNNLDPMYQDEYILGFQKMITEDWLVGMRAIRRDLKSGMDDICDGLNARSWALANGYSESQADAIFDALEHCFLTNPGQDLSANVDLDGTGTLTRVDIPASALGFPEAVRKYRAVEFFFERAWDDKWFLQGSYTWAKSYGNTEGYVRSDNAQDDAGITTSFDYVGLMDGSYGYLPNDRRHSLKVFGAYQVAEEWRVGANLLVQSGRPKNCFGVYPEDGPSQNSILYGAESFYCGGVLTPRGSLGRTPWVKTVDLQIAYAPNWAEGLSFRADITNIFNSKDYNRIQEVYEDSGREQRTSYGHPRGFVIPRTVQLSLEYLFDF